MNSFHGTHPPSTAPRRRRRVHGGGGATSTPLHHWTSYNNNTNKHQHFSSDAGDEAKFSGGRHVVDQSARKLAAGFWRLRSLRYGIGGFSARRRPSYRSHFEHSKSNAADCRASNIKFLEEQVKTMSLVSTMQAELVQARLYIHNLEYEVRSSKNRVEYLASKLRADRTSRKKTEHDEIYALVDDFKRLLSRETKKLEKMDVINCQLVKELSEAKLSAARSIQKYEDEKHIRKVLEEVCHELAKNIGEDKSEVEAMRIETLKMREEVEEERRMLHVADVWREERVQMKLLDAKLALECKYSQLNKLITVLETFLSSKSSSLNLPELRKTEWIGRAIQAVSVQDMEEFSHGPIGSGDICSIFEELQPWFNYSLSVDISDYHPVSPENYHDTDRVPKHSSGVQDTKGHDEHNRAASQGLVEESGRSIVTVSGPMCEKEQDVTASRVSAIKESNGVCSISAGQPTSKKSSYANLRTSCSRSSVSYKAITDEGNGRIWSGTVSSTPGRYLPIGHYGSTDLHVHRDTKGCIEWPGGYEKNTLKAKRVPKTRNLECKDIIQVNR